MLTLSMLDVSHDYRLTGTYYLCHRPSCLEVGLIRSSFGKRVRCAARHTLGVTMRTQAYLMGAALSALLFAGPMLSSTAFAATHNLGDLTPGTSGATAGATDVGVTSIDLIGTFTSSTEFDVSVSTTTAVIRQIISDATLWLFSGTPTGPNTVLEQVSVSKVGSAYFGSLSDSGLAAGSYFVEFTDTASAPVSPTISVTTASTTVPESSTWAMMVLGFAGLGFAGLRGRGTAVSIA